MDARGIGLVLRPVSSLVPHEETIPGQAERLAKQMEKDGLQKDPLIFERDHGIVLDGMHRLAAFRELGLQYAVCYPIDYSSPYVALRGWVRVFDAGPEGGLRDRLEALGVSAPAPLEDVFRLVEDRNAAVAALNSDWSLVAAATKDGSADSGFEIVRSLDSEARRLGWVETFVPDEDLDLVLEDRRKVAVILPRFTKQDVVNAGLRGRLMPYKTTMHAVDPRPVAIRFPLAPLKGRSPPAALLAETLARARPRSLAEGSDYEGRRYKEKLLLVNPL